MIVRESPKSGARNATQNWPPKSPHEALLSSPSGRRKYERQRSERTVSPSPVKRRPLSRALPGGSGDASEDDDEEMLELKLAQIEARLKLKRLQKERVQKARGVGQQISDDEREMEEERMAMMGRTGMPRPSRASKALGTRRTELPRPQSAVEVPVSPVRNRREPEEQTSPARVRLGIDKGLRAQDVSLKRAASFHSRNPNTTTRETETPRGKSFSQRLAESRSNVKEREEKQARIEKSRSRGFGLSEVLGTRDGAASSLSSGTRGSHELSTPSRREEIGKSRSIADLRSTQSQRPSSNLSRDPPINSTPRPASNLSSRTESSRAPTASGTPGPYASSRTASKYAEISQRDNTAEASSFESFSSLHLKTRHMEHNNLTRVLEGKTVLTIPQLLKTVKAPDYDPPDMENDYVVFGLICSKSSPLTPKNAPRERSVGNKEADVNQSGKFMVIKLTDLKWELDLYLFDTGFSQFWKLPIGTLVAILNPDIMPPRTRDTGKFSLKLTSSDDTVLEVGTGRDLDFCHAKRKDGKDCGQWIDGRKTEYCDFHIELQVEKSRRGRMEINTMAGTGLGKGPGRPGAYGGGAGRGKPGGLKNEGGRVHDAFLHETMYIVPGAGGAARAFDSDEHGFERGASRAERHRKQLAEREKERELAKKLGEIGGGAGADYMRVKGAEVPNLPARGDALGQPTTAEKPDFLNETFGLLGRKAEDVSLAPVKRKRIASGKSTVSSEPVGWSGAFKRLPSPTKPSSFSNRDTREPSPAKKKARLLLPEKGIREPGRDSLGTMDVGLLAAMDAEDDDDDLEFI